MPPRFKFRVELKGSFYTYELYDERGAEVFDLEDAVRVANWLYPDQWSCVYNGSESAVPEDSQ